MERIQQQRITQTGKRRITLTLPADSLTQAERIARARKVNLSSVISEALGFSDEEMLLLDGIVLDRPATRL